MARNILSSCLVAGVFLSPMMVANSQEPVPTNAGDDKDESLQSLIEKAEGGDAGAQYELSQHFYRLGSGGNRKSRNAREDARQPNSQRQANIQQWMKWLKLAAENGDDRAQFAMISLPNTPDERRFWWRKLADKGNPFAQFELGRLYENEANLAEAFKWYMKAANQGAAGAMNNVGIYYYQSNPGTRDYVQAYAWFMLAESRGAQPAKGFGSYSQICRGKMTKSEIQKAESILLKLQKQVPVLTEEQVSKFRNPK